MHYYLRSYLQIVIFSCIFVSKSVVSSLSFEYIGYKLYRVMPENDIQLEVLTILRNSNSGIFFWNGIERVGKEVDILVSPDVRAFFLDHLISHDIVVKEYCSIVKIVMEQRELPTTLPTTNNDNVSQVPTQIVVQKIDIGATPQHIEKDPIPNILQNNTNYIGPLQNNTNTSPLQNNTNYIGSSQNNTNYTGSLQNNTNYTGPLQNNTNYTGPLQNNTNDTDSLQNNTNYTGSLQNNTNYTGSLQNNTNYTDSLQNNTNYTGPLQKNTNESALELELIPVQPVPGTKLLTGTFYTLGLLRYPKGFVTWTEQSTDKGNYVQIDFKASTQQYYTPTGKLHLDAQWMIAPTENANAFLLINRGLPGGTFTWTNEKSPNGYFVQLSRREDETAFYRPGGKWRQDALIFINATEVEDHYIIQIANFPTGIITWTNKYGGPSNKFLQVDTSPGSMTNYHPGQIWRDNALFRFSPLRKIKLSGAISNFRYGIDNSSTTILPTRRVNIISADKLKIPNNIGTPQSFVLKHNKTLTGYYSVKFNQTFNHFANISCKASLPLKLTNPENDSDIEFSWTQGMELTIQNLERAVKHDYLINTILTILPYKTLEVSWYVTWVDDLQVKFAAQVAVTGFIERMSADRKVQKIPVSVLDVYYLLSSENILGSIVGVRGNEVLVNIQGTFKGTYAVKNTFLTINV